MSYFGPSHLYFTQLEIVQVQMCNHFNKTGFTNLNVFEALGFYILCHASLSSVMSLPIYICLLPFLTTNFKEPLLLTFFSAGEIQKSTIICMNITEILLWNSDEETARRGLKYETEWRIFLDGAQKKNWVKKHNIATHWMKTHSSQNKVQEQLRDK